ncbi:MAG: GNAT family N-acetyltransferase [Vicinamibacterales bacterium]
MTIVDWRGVDARTLALVFARERARWLADLGWDTREAWLHIERARTTWGLPGLAAVDEGGRVRGLTFFHDTNGRFDIGGVFADSDRVRERLLETAISVCEDAKAGEISTFFYSTDTATAGVLATRGFELEQVDYLSLALDRAHITGTGRALTTVACRGWQNDDVEALAGLLHVSYDPEAARRFVPEVTPEGWRHYVSTLVTHGACGAVLPSMTRLAWSQNQLVGAVLATDLGPATAHIAQVAVHPAWRRKGLAGDLIDEAVSRAMTSGYARITLLASAVNPSAQKLYRDRGFVATATFMAASRQREAFRIERAS